MQLSVLSGPGRERIRNLDKLPFPAYDLLPNFDLYKQPPNVFKATRSMALITTRGCPGHCKFCSMAVFGSKIFSHSSGWIFEVISWLVKDFDVQHIFFEDDTFTHDPHRVIELCEKLINSRFGIPWSCAARVDFMNPDLLRIMKRAGCWLISYGIETGDPEILKFIGKEVTIEKIERVIAETHEAGIITKGFFMVGHPTETKETIKKTINFARKAKLDEFQCSVFTPLPGSVFYRTAHKYGTFEDDWRRMSYWDILFIPHGLTRHDLLGAQKRAFWVFYLQPRIIVKMLKKLNSWSNIKNIIRGLRGLISYSFFQKAQDVQPQKEN